MNKKILINYLFIVSIACPISFAEVNILPVQADKISDSTAAETVEQLEKIMLAPKEENVPVLEHKEEQIEGKHEAESSVTYLFSSKSKSSSEKTSLTEADFDYSYEFKLFGQLPLTLSLGSEYIDINHDSGLDLPSHLTGLSAGLEATLPFFNLDKTYIAVGVEPSFYSDDWGLHTSAFRMPFNTYAIYVPNDKLVLICGVAVFPDFKEKVFPIFCFVYKPNEKVLFNITSENPSIVYSPNKKWTFFGEIRTPLGGEFEVKRQGRDGVVLMYSDTRIGAGAAYNFNKSVSATLSMGGAFGRYFKYRDEDGKLSLDNGLYGKFSIDVEI
jgi:hypothetical protein